MVRPQLHHISNFFPIWATARCYFFLLILCSIDEGEGVLEEYFGQTCVGDAGNGAFGVFFTKFLSNLIPNDRARNGV
jgi:hypothetical protein